MPNVCNISAKTDDELDMISDESSSELDLSQDLSVINDVVQRINQFGPVKKDDRPKISVQEIVIICQLAIEILKRDGAFLEFKDKSKDWAVLGDIHGQFNDMISLLKLFCDEWACKQKGLQLQYLFLGDYVDRGDFSLEVMVSLLCWKILCPEDVYLLRGNHECLTVNGRYGFRKELINIYGSKEGNHVWRIFNIVFDYFPIAATIHDEYFCVHGGITDDLYSLKQLRNLKLPQRIKEGSRCFANRVLWSDPDRSGQTKHFSENPRRGPLFGPDACKKFLETNGIKRIIRAHQIAQNGFWHAFDNKVMTVFSAPNYKNSGTNDAGLLIIRNCKSDAGLLMFTCSKDARGDLTANLTLTMET